MMQQSTSIWEAPVRVCFYNFIFISNKRGSQPYSLFWLHKWVSRHGWTYCGLGICLDDNVGRCLKMFFPFLEHFYQPFKTIYFKGADSNFRCCLCQCLRRFNCRPVDLLSSGVPVVGCWVFDSFRYLFDYSIYKWQLRWGARSQMAASTLSKSL